LVGEKSIPKDGFIRMDKTGNEWSRDKKKREGKRSCMEGKEEVKLREGNKKR